MNGASIVVGELTMKKYGWATRHGALLVTSNGADFELIREYRDFPLEVW
jgi:hypothetical protein